MLRAASDCRPSASDAFQHSRLTFARRVIRQLTDHLVNIAGENPLQRLLVIFRPIDYFGDLRAASDIPVERAQAMQKTRGPIFIEAPHHEWRGYSIIPRRARPAATFSLFSDQMLQQLMVAAWADLEISQQASRSPPHFCAC
jgi:hypothetical protein